MRSDGVVDVADAVAATTLGVIKRFIGGFEQVRARICIDVAAIGKGHAKRRNPKAGGYRALRPRRAFDA